MAFDIYQEITDRIVAELNTGIIPWEKPWTGTRDGAISYATGKPYSLLNQLLLRKAGEYATFKQIQAAGGKVKKGAKSKFVVFWKIYRKEKLEGSEPARDKDGNIKYDTIPVLRYYNVFHVVDDCEGITPKHEQDAPNGAETMQTAEDVLTAYTTRENLTIHHEKGDKAYYSPLGDYIVLPLMEQFKDTAEYYGTAFHESVHSTGHSTRLNRFDKSTPSHFGDEDYSKEELVAEIGSCALLHRLNMETRSSFRNNAAYIQSWLRALNNDKRMIVSAAGKAEKAVAYILGENTAENTAEAAGE